MRPLWATWGVESNGRYKVVLVPEKDIRGCRVLPDVPGFFQAIVSRMQIRPHRFGGEGVLIGGQSATLNAQ